MFHARRCWIRRSLMMLAVSLCAASSTAQTPPNVRWWLSSADLASQLAPQPPLRFEQVKSAPQVGEDRIVIDTHRRFQTMLGMGSSLEHSTCSNLFRLPPDRRTEVLRRLMDPQVGIGINLARICIGTPDFTAEPWYSYHDLPPGQRDPELTQFSIDRDRTYILPVIKEALQINPELRLFASPWSPPGWMTSTGDMIGGHLLPEHYDAYARYFVKFIQAYRQEGIAIHAVTVQNEPGVDRSRDQPAWHYPSCRYTAEQERTFIRDHLGPAFAREGIETEIWSYDHNFNVQPTPDGDDPGIQYPAAVLSDPAAAKFIGGVAFHGYAGQPEGMSEFHQQFPAVPIHFTEGSVFGPAGGRKLIGYLRHWASSYNGWVTLLTADGQPNNGPFRASRTCVTLDPETLQVTYHYDYYQYGHFFRFIKRGAQRIGADGGDRTLAGVAFENPDRQLVLVLVNSGRREREVTVGWEQHLAKVTLPRRSVATLTWPSALDASH